MASLKRACYKCGNVGHYAEVCTSTERLCYNCKQPGHESNACPNPRTAESKQCYHCQGVGHVQADCPTLRLSGGAGGAKCYSCSGVGHVARNCPNNQIGSNPRGHFANPRGAGAYTPALGRNGSIPRFAGQNNRAATCYKCGGPNHFAKDCQAQAIKCYACGKLGHISRDCTSVGVNAGSATPSKLAGAASAVADKTCYRCGEPGHISRDCPQTNSLQQQQQPQKQMTGLVAAGSAAGAAGVDGYVTGREGLQVLDGLVQNGGPHPSTLSQTGSVPLAQATA